MGKLFPGINGRYVTRHRMYVFMSAMEILKGTSFVFCFLITCLAFCISQQLCMVGGVPMLEVWKLRPRKMVTQTVNGKFRI